MSKKHDYFIINSAYKKIKSYPILIELKCGIFCSGKILKFGENLNIFIEKAVLSTENGFIFKEISVLFINGKTIKVIKFV
ncbi:small nuclear ribonucleoprotein D-like protein (nucleomorph) [Chroomonas mesostigmatica CCMP1168]|uniref:Small nuclear ribonucleoprotein D-like protein n=1 Tax=Chroomonas mesostigmatica CCMP1168 TaxID=1195612 RepID=J7GAN4_9CRYP|nr:small nuclear ribonucleoprotein D-like protein [Chroomonas mesostigmatica CCMP1168]